MQLDIRNNPEMNRFEAPLGDQFAMIEYILRSNVIALTHTEVPPGYRGQGIADKMAYFALEYAKDHGYKIVPSCPFVAAYIQRHPEYQSHTV